MAVTSEYEKERINRVNEYCKRLSNLKVGDVVRVECDSGLGSGGNNILTDITTKYDEDTGEPYKLLWFDEHAFDGRTGRAYNPPTAYYLDI